MCGVIGAGMGSEELEAGLQTLDQFLLCHLKSQQQLG